MLKTLILYDLGLLWQARAQIIQSLTLFVMLIAIFPLSVEKSQEGREMLALFAPAVIWACGIFISNISLSFALEEDRANGMMEQWLTLPTPMGVVIFAKIVAHYIGSFIPLAMLSPLISYMLGMRENIIYIPLTLLIGGVGISAVGMMAKALTLGIKRNTALLPLISIPFYIPIIIFGTGFFSADGVSAEPFFLGLGICALLLLPASILAGAAALRISVEEG